MGSWGEKIFANDTNADTAGNIKDSWLKDPQSSRILYAFLKKNADAKYQNKLRTFFDGIAHIVHTSTPSKLEEKLQNFVWDNEVVSDMISDLIERTPQKNQATFSHKELSYLLETAAAALFHPSDFEALSAQTLTCQGVLKDNGKYKKPQTHELEGIFYVLGYLFTALPLAGKKPALSPYYFERFLEASNYFLSEEVIERWVEPAKRIKTLHAEQQQVVQHILNKNISAQTVKNAMGIAPEHLKPLLEQKYLELSTGQTAENVHIKVLKI